MTEQENFNYEDALAACAQGDARSLHQLYTQEAPRLLGVVRRIVRDQGQAEDILHDVFLTVWRKASSFDPARGSGRGWLYTIARHAALDRARRHLRLITADEATLSALLDADRFDQPVLEAALTSQALGQLGECLARLEPGKRDSIVMAYLDGCTQAEVAQRMGKPLGTIKAWIRRGLLSLRECLS